MDPELLQFMVCLVFRENIKMLAVPTNDISDQKYFVHLIRTSLTKSGTNFEPIRSFQYFGEKTNQIIYTLNNYNYKSRKSFNPV